MADYELIDHTADIGIIVRADNLKGLFAGCARAMFDVIAQAPESFQGLETKKCAVALRGEDSKELLVLWLSELLSLSDCEDIYFTDFDIQQISEKNIRAEVSGFYRRYFEGKREVKAVTYHDLSVRETQGGLEARVIFDV